MKELLYKLGKLIREQNHPIPARHGTHWTCTLQSGAHFYHDDYNNSVSVSFPNGKRIYFGMDFGGLEIHATEQQFKDAINALELNTAGVLVSTAQTHA